MASKKGAPPTETQKSVSDNADYMSEPPFKNGELDPRRVAKVKEIWEDAKKRAHPPVENHLKAVFNRPSRERSSSKSLFSKDRIKTRKPVSTSDEVTGKLPNQTSERQQRPASTPSAKSNSGTIKRITLAFLSAVFIIFILLSIVLIQRYVSDNFGNEPIFGKDWDVVRLIVGIIILIPIVYLLISAIIYQFRGWIAKKLSAKGREKERFLLENRQKSEQQIRSLVKDFSLRQQSFTLSNNREAFLLWHPNKKKLSRFLFIDEDGNLDTMIFQPRSVEFRTIYGLSGIRLLAENTSRRVLDFYNNHIVGNDAPEFFIILIYVFLFPFIFIQRWNKSTCLAYLPTIAKHKKLPLLSRFEFSTIKPKGMVMFVNDHSGIHMTTRFYPDDARVTHSGKNPIPDGLSMVAHHFDIENILVLTTAHCSVRGIYEKYVPVTIQKFKGCPINIQEYIVDNESIK